MTGLERLIELKQPPQQEPNSAAEPATPQINDVPVTEEGETTPDITDAYPDPFTGDQVLDDDQLQIEQLKHIVRNDLMTISEGNLALEGTEGANRKRGRSLNPEWFQENPDMTSVKYVREAVAKFAAGKVKLGVKQQRVIDALKAQLKQEKADGAQQEEAQEKAKDAATQRRDRIDQLNLEAQQRAQEEIDGADTAQKKPNKIAEGVAKRGQTQEPPQEPPQ